MWCSVAHLPTPCALQGCLCRNALHEVATTGHRPWSLSRRLNSSHKSKAAPRCCCPLLPAAQAARCLLTGTVGDQFKPSLLRAAAAARARGLCCGCFAIAVTLVIVKRSDGARQLPHCSFPLSAHVSHVAKRVRLYCVGRQVVKLLSMVALDFRWLFNCSKKASHGEGSTIVQELRPLHVMVYDQLSHVLEG